MEDGGFFSAALYPLLNKVPGIQIAAGGWVDTLSWTRSARAALLGAVALGAMTLGAVALVAAALGTVTAALGTVTAALGTVAAASSAATPAGSNALLQFLQLETDMPHVFHLLSVLDWRDFRSLFFGVL